MAPPQPAEQRNVEQRWVVQWDGRVLPRRIAHVHPPAWISTAKRLFFGIVIFMKWTCILLSIALFLLGVLGLVEMLSIMTWGPNSY